ncbi:MAG: biotin/lipoate A/B protein ligase family protein [Desulfurococcaceae archaeon]
MTNKAVRAIICEWPSNQFFNIAFEEALFRSANEPTIRFWRNDRAIVIGRLQSPILEINAIEAFNHGIKLVRRFTGGGAVYQDLGNVNYAISLPGFKLSLEEGFKLVGEAVADSLKALGVKDAYYRPLNDIEVEGLKISGLAATRSPLGLFVHGSMLVSSNTDIMWRVLKISKEKLSDKKFTSSRVKRVVNLEEALGRAVNITEILNVIGESLSKKLGVQIEWGSYRQREAALAVELYKTRYSRIDWNLAYTEELRTLITDEEYRALYEIGKPSSEQEKVLETLVV